MVMTSPIHLVYRAYGARAFLDQTLYSILSFDHHYPAWRDAVQIVVYTDQPNYFASAGLGIVCEELTSTRIKAWSGPYNFVHRLKFEMLRDAMLRWHSPLLYVDGDTYWLSPPDNLLQALRAGRTIMHTFEGDVSPQFHPALHECLTRQAAPIQKSTGLKVSPTTPMWNTGVVGLPLPQVEVLDQALQLCDTLFLCCYQREWLEQFAFSMLLQQYAPILSAERAISHYWGYADEATAIIRDLLRRAHTAGTPFPTIDPAALEKQCRAIQRSPTNRRQQRAKRLRRSYQKRLTHWRVMVDNLTGRA